MRNSGKLSALVVISSLIALLASPFDCRGIKKSIKERIASQYNSSIENIRGYKITNSIKTEYPDREEYEFYVKKDNGDIYSISDNNANGELDEGDTVSAIKGEERFSVSFEELNEPDKDFCDRVLKNADQQNVDKVEVIK